ADAATAAALDSEIRGVRAEGADLLGADPDRVRATESDRQSRITVLRGRATRALNAAETRREVFVERLRNFRILDPACGSGNFLYLALRALKDVEHRVNIECEGLGLPRRPPRVGPESVRGIE